MTPTIFAQVSFMPTYSNIGMSFNSILQALQVCYVCTCHTSSYIMSSFPWCPQPTFSDRKCTVFFYSIMVFCCSSLPSFCFWGNSSTFHHVKKKNQLDAQLILSLNQLDAQLILSLFRQPLHVLGISRPIIRRYNRMCTTIGIYYQDNKQSSEKNIKYQLLYTCGCTSWWWA